jgi:DNA-binding MarR family transcriptional regulator
MTSPRKRPHHAWSESHAPDTLPLILHLHHAREITLVRARPIWARHTLTPAEFDVLAALRNAPPPYRLTPSQLQDCVLITSGGLTKVMRQLEARNLVLRSQDPHDQRVKPIRLTHAGRTLIEHVMAEVGGAADAWLRSILDAQEIATLSALLKRLADTPVASLAACRT